MILYTLLYTTMDCPHLCIHTILYFTRAPRIHALTQYTAVCHISTTHCALILYPIGKLHPIDGILDNTLFTIHH